MDNPEAKEMCRPHITYNNDSRKPVGNRKNSEDLYQHFREEMQMANQHRKRSWSH